MMVKGAIRWRWIIERWLGCFGCRGRTSRAKTGEIHVTSDYHVMTVALLTHRVVAPDNNVINYRAFHVPSVRT